MTIAVAYKWAPDPADISVGRGETSISWDGSGISDSDPVAIAVGRRLADAVGQELVGITFGGRPAAATSAEKTALAHGLDRLLVATADLSAFCGPLETARHLAALVSDLDEVSLVLTGDASADGVQRIVPAVLAGVLQWPCLLEARDIQPSVGCFEVTLADGRRQHCPSPAVIAVTPDAAETRRPGMRDILAAALRPARERTVEPDVLADAVVSDLRRPETPARRRLIVEDDAEAAGVLVRSLRREGVL